LDDRLQRKIAENAAPYLEPGETVRAAVYGQTNVVPPNDVALLLRIAQGRIVAVTQRNLYVFRRGIFSFTKPKSLLAKYPLGSVTVSSHGTLLNVATERIYVHLFVQGWARQVAQAAGGAVT
jgi:hypothetical protein